VDADGNTDNLVRSVKGQDKRLLERRVSSFLNEGEFAAAHFVCDLHHFLGHVGETISGDHAASERTVAVDQRLSGL
jgi:hypothetical protein